MNYDQLPLNEHLQEQLQATAQNPRYHAEGSVLAHTKLVVQKYYELRDEFELSPQEKKILHWAAVLHDLGKISTSVYQGERWRSPGHEKAGVPIARNILIKNKDVSAEER